MHRNTNEELADLYSQKATGAIFQFSPLGGDWCDMDEPQPFLYNCKYRVKPLTLDEACDKGLNTNRGKALILYNGYQMIESFKDGVKWQKEQDE